MKNQYFDFDSISSTAGSSNSAINTEISSAFVEFIAVDWFDCVHGDEFGVKKQVESITPQSIPFVRDIANNFVIDVLFYLTPEYHHRISTFVTKKLNHVYSKFLELNPNFKGNCSILGHSLGSVISFDILTSQIERQSNTEPVDRSVAAEDGRPKIIPAVDNANDEVFVPTDNELKRLSVTAGKYATAYSIGHREQQLVFKPIAFYAIGSPIGL
jgi:hypothetical protein